MTATLTHLSALGTGAWIDARNEIALPQFSGRSETAPFLVSRIRVSFSRYAETSENHLCHLPMTLPR
jgi:hypothetical protein